MQCDTMPGVLTNKNL